MDVEPVISNLGFPFSLFFLKLVASTETESLMRCISLLILLKADFGGDKEVVWPRSQAFST
jgi:hypothetical protein